MDSWKGGRVQDPLLSFVCEGKREIPSLESSF